MECIKEKCSYYRQYGTEEAECCCFNELWEIFNDECFLDANVKQMEYELNKAKEQLRLLRTIDKHRRRRSNEQNNRRTNRNA